MKKEVVRLDWASDKPVSRLYMPEWQKVDEQNSLRPTVIENGEMIFSPQGDKSKSRNAFLNKVRAHLRAGGTATDEVYNTYVSRPRWIPSENYSEETKRALQGKEYPLL